MHQLKAYSLNYKHLVLPTAVLLELVYAFFVVKESSLAERCIDCSRYDLEGAFGSRCSGALIILLQGSVVVLPISLSFVSFFRPALNNHVMAFTRASFSFYLHLWI